MTSTAHNLEWEDGNGDVFEVVVTAYYSAGRRQQELDPEEHEEHYIESVEWSGAMPRGITEKDATDFFSAEENEKFIEDIEQNTLNDMEAFQESEAEHMRDRMRD
jgi:hypothetical protein